NSYSLFILTLLPAEYSWLTAAVRHKDEFYELMQFCGFNDVLRFFNKQYRFIPPVNSQQPWHTKKRN
ncbi:hypothetical protein CRQ32_21260, partial [Salmonella enterica]|nr:hypothetical protein [Salmonella enterica]